MKHSYFFLLASSVLLLSCSKSNSSDPTPNAGPAYEGSVNMVDEFGTAKADRSSVTVTVTDTSPNWAVQTSTTGAYSIPLGNVPAGNHQLRFSYPGYGTYIKANAATGAAIPTIILSQLTTTHVTVAAAKSGSVYVIQGSTVERPTAAQPRPYRLFLTRSFAPAPPLPIATAYYLTLNGTPAADGSFSVTLTASDLTAAGFRTGDDVLVYAAGDNPAASTYVDASTSKTVYPASNMSINTTAALFGFR